jgi:hypothetical protein
MQHLQTGGFIQDIYKQSATQLHDLDTVNILKDGRMFAYALAGTTALDVSKVNQASAPVSTANNEALPATGAAAIGATEVIVTFGAAVVADQYKNGWLWANDATGEGHLYRVKGHAAGTATVTIYLKDPIRTTALAASTSEVTLIANRQNGLIVCPTTLTGLVTGINPIPVTASYYFWNQVKGPAVVLVDTGATIVVGNHVTIGGTAAGSVGPLATDSILPVLGTVMSVNVATEYALINLDIPGY